MEKKRGRGRPRVAERIAGGSADMYEKLATDGRKFRSRRSVADATYAFSAAILLSKSGYVIEDLDVICGENYQCRSILNQLGRMYRTEGYSEKDVVKDAKAAIQGKKDGHSVKEIEQYIKHGRKTGEW